MNAFLGKCSIKRIFIFVAAVCFASPFAPAQEASSVVKQTQLTTAPGGASRRDYNQQLQRLLRETASPADASAQDYRIGPGDLLEISIFEAPELNRTVRVSADGELTLPLVGDVHAAGLSSHDLESVVDELLRRNYLTDPHVSVFVKELESHGVSVLGAVENPGVYQIRGSKSLIELLSMSHGLSDDAGDTVIVMRHGASAFSTSADSPDPNSAVAPDEPAPSAKLNEKPTIVTGSAESGSLEIKLKDLLDSGDPSYNVMVNPGDVVKVPRAGIVYVVGEVHKPGGFVLKTNESISVLQALALAEGITHTAAGKRARIIRTDKLTNARSEVSIDLNKVLAGHAPDLMLNPKDILFVPNSTGKSALFRGTEAALSITTGVIVYRR